MLPDFRLLVLWARYMLCLHVAAGLGFHRPPADLMRAIAQEAPSDQDAALLVVWSAKESGLQNDPAPWSEDARNGLSHGYLQLRGKLGIGSARHQVRAWLAIRKQWAERCGDDGLSGLASGHCGGAKALVAHRLSLADSLGVGER